MDVKVFKLKKGEKPLDNINPTCGFAGIFRTVGVIGDSLSSGEFESHDQNGQVQYHDMYEYSWPSVLQRITGTRYNNYSRGGMTAKEYCESFAERKARMAELADGFFVLPGGIGTLEEAFEVLTNLSIDRTRKPIGFVSTGGYYDPLFRMLETAQKEGFLGDGALSRVRVKEDPEALLAELLELLDD